MSCDPKTCFAAHYFTRHYDLTNKAARKGITACALGPKCRFLSGLVVDASAERHYRVEHLGESPKLLDTSPAPTPKPTEATPKSATEAPEKKPDDTKIEAAPAKEPAGPTPTAGTPIGDTAKTSTPEKKPDVQLAKPMSALAKAVNFGPPPISTPVKESEIKPAVGATLTAEARKLHATSVSPRPGTPSGGSKVGTGIAAKQSAKPGAESSKKTATQTAAKMPTKTSTKQVNAPPKQVDEKHDANSKEESEEGAECEDDTSSEGSDHTSKPSPLAGLCMYVRLNRDGWAVGDKIYHGVICGKPANLTHNPSKDPLKNYCDDCHRLRCANKLRKAQGVGSGRGKK